ncbi:MAG: hypothetical protein IIA82_08290 [Thaumarchaeota archaeon]|nr:hypothetical protein [Nitrososphaerota archaeon]
MEKWWKLFWIIWSILLIALAIWYYYESEESDIIIGTSDSEESGFTQLYWYPDSPNAIAWKANYLLNWTHFDAEPDINSEHEAYIFWNFIAERECDSIENISNENYVTVSSTAYMYQDQSWVNENHTSYDELLIHEQKHFDLTEVFARKLQDRIENEIIPDKTSCRKIHSNFIIPPVIDKQILFLENEERKLLKRTQCLYDNKTDHNRNGTIQRDWYIMIEDWLEDGIDMDFLDEKYSIFTIMPKC